MIGHELVNELLVEVGVGSVFHYMAEDTMELIQDLESTWEDEVDVVHSRHEQGAVEMADAYSRCGDRIGVAVVGRGPGVAQTGKGLINAKNNGSKVLLIVPTFANSEAHDTKDFKQGMYLESTVERVVTATGPEALGQKTREALWKVHIGESPVALQIPKDVLNNEVDVSASHGELYEIEEILAREDGPELLRYGASRSSATGYREDPDESLIDEAVERYLDSDAYQPPVILAGEGAAHADAKDAIYNLAERINAVLVTTLKGRDYFMDHPFHLGITGSWGNPLSNRHLNEANYVIAVGASLSHHTTDDGRLLADDTTLIHIDADPTSIGRFTPVDLGIVGDAKRTIEALDAAFDAEGIQRGTDLWTDDLRGEIEEFSAIVGPEFDIQPGTMDPREAIKAIDRVVPEARLLGTDGGQFRKWVIDGIRAPPENSILSCDFSAIGVGVAMGVGIGQYVKDGRAAGGDDRTPLTVVGDGGFMMAAQEVETAARHDIPLVIVVMNDSSLGAEYHELQARGVAPDIALIDTPRLSEVATAFGAEGHTVNSVEEIEELEDAVARPDGPVVVECIVDPDVRHRTYG